MTDQELVRQVLQARPVAYRVDFARIGGGVLAGVFLSQLFYWSDKGQRADGYIYKTREEWEEETGLTRKNLETARKHLRGRGLITEHKRSIPARLHYRIEFSAVVDALRELYEQTCPTSKPEPDQQVGTNRTDLPARTVPTIPETTTENTAVVVTAAASEDSLSETASAVLAILAEGNISPHARTKKLAGDITEERAREAVAFLRQNPRETAAVIIQLESGEEFHVFGELPQPEPEPKALGTPRAPRQPDGAGFQSEKERADTLREQAQ